MARPAPPRRNPRPPPPPRPRRDIAAAAWSCRANRRPSRLPRLAAAEPRRSRAGPTRRLHQPPRARRRARAAVAADDRNRAEAGRRAGDVRLQLGAVRSAGMARAEWDRLKRGNPDLLGHLTAVAVRADLGDQGRLLPHPDGAGRGCGTRRSGLRRAEAAPLGCIIVR